MEQYISKSAVVAEIRRIMAEEMSFFEDCCEDELEYTSSPVVYTRMEMLLSFLDTLEVKEVQNAVDGICISNGAECGATIESSAGMLFLQHNTLDVGDKVKIIIVRED